METRNFITVYTQPLPVMGQINLIHTLPSYLLKIYFNIIFPFIPKSSKRFVPFSFLTKILFGFLFFPIRATYSYNLRLDTLPQVFLMLKFFEGGGGGTQTQERSVVDRPYFSCTSYAVSN
jgi:hypothetical protein